MAGGDVEEAEFVGAGGIIDLGLLDRIARIGQVKKLHALDHAPTRDVEARNDADADGHKDSSRDSRSAFRRSSVPS